MKRMISGWKGWENEKHEYRMRKWEGWENEKDEYRMRRMSTGWEGWFQDDKN